MPQNLKSGRRPRCAPGCSAALLLLATTLAPAGALATCSAYTAAEAGSETGYNAAKQAADSWAQREQDSTNALSECLGDISTTIVMPKFPDLSGILSKIEQKVCAAAQSTIDSYIPDTIDPWSDLPVPTDSTTIPVTATRSALPASVSRQPRSSEPATSLPATPEPEASAPGTADSRFSYN
jgi:TraL protein